MTSTTDTGVANDELSGLDAATDAFLANFTPEAGDEDADPKRRQPSETNESKTPTEESDEKPEATDDDKASDESPEEETSEEADDKSTAKDTKKYAESDDIFVKIKVGDQEHEVSVKDLKRLHGQEAALTRKSQALAEQVKKVDTDAQRYTAALQTLTQKAEAKANQFRQINWLALSRDTTVSAEQLSILQDEARKALEEETYLKNELGKFVEDQNKVNREQFTARAQACVKELTDAASPHYIEGWNKQLYDNIRSFATGEGLEADIVNQLVDPAAFKLLHMAMAFKAGQKKVLTQKVDKTPKKIVKTSNTPVAPNLKTSKEKQAMAKLRAEGSMDNARDAFLARLEAHEQD